MPSFFTGVTASSSRNNSSSSGSRGGLTLGGLIEARINSLRFLQYHKKTDKILVIQNCQEWYLYTLRSSRSRGIPRSGSTKSFGLYAFSNDVIVYFVYLEEKDLKITSSEMEQNRIQLLLALGNTERLIMYRINGNQTQARQFSVCGNDKIQDWLKLWTTIEDDILFFIPFHGHELRLCTWIWQFIPES